MSARLVAAVVVLLSSGGAALAVDSVAASPYPGPPRSIGSAAHGCLAGAEAMPLSGPGWEVLRPLRNRYWGHPGTIAFIERKAAETQVLGTLLVADIAQPRGGHMTSGHGSHQTGVDVDILFRVQSGPLTDAERAEPDLTGVVLAGGGLDPARWGPTQVSLLRAFASDPQVERIFVNPAIKRVLCQTATGDRAWLRTLRPWWGHDEHFHTRLRCPVGDRDCISGPAVPPGEGCGSDLDWWFTPEAAAPTPPKPGTVPPAMPAACLAILHATH